MFKLKDTLKDTLKATLKDNKYIKLTLWVVIALTTFALVYGCTSTSTYTMTSTQIQNIDTDTDKDNTKGTGKKVESKSVTQVKLM